MDFDKSISTRLGYDSPFGETSLFQKSNQHNEKENVFITKISGPTLVYKGGVFEYKIVSFNTSGFSINKILSKIKWGYSFDGGQIKPIRGVRNKLIKDTLEIRAKLKFKVITGHKVRVFAWLVKPSKDVSVLSSVLQFPFYFDRYKLKGYNRSLTGLADDLGYGDGITQTKYLKYTKNEVEKLGSLMKSNANNSSNENLWSGLKSMVSTLFSIGELEKIALLMVAKFKRNEGGEFKNDVLTKHVSKHKTTKTFCKAIETSIQEKLYQNKGNITILEDSNIYMNSERYGRPHFASLGDTFFGGLTICINDTWAYEVTIIDYNTKDNINYSLSYSVTLYDHFGLDYPDLEVSSYYSLFGFRAWFILQHLRNFKPFITKVEINKTIKGNINIGKERLDEAEKKRVDFNRELRYLTRKKGWEY